MALVGEIISMPRVFGGIIAGFIAILGLRVTWPMMSLIMDMFDSGVMKVAATLSMWLVITFVLWYFVWLKFFEKPQEGINNG